MVSLLTVVHFCHMLVLLVVVVIALFAVDLLVDMSSEHLPEREFFLLKRCIETFPGFKPYL